MGDRTMKQGTTRRLFLLVAVVLLGLIAGLGGAAPASASAIVFAPAQQLTLAVSSSGAYTIDGREYRGETVDVWVVQVSNRDRVVDSEKVRPGGDNAFRIRGWGLDCGQTYQAVTYSSVDGWDKSARKRVSC